MVANGSRGALRGGQRPHFLSVETHDTFQVDRIGGLVPQTWRLSRCDQYDLEQRDLDDVDVVYVPGSHDQLFFKSIEARLVKYLATGGHFLINGHIFLSWLPYLRPFKAVPPRPFSNWRIRPADPGEYFGRMDFETFHLWDGVLGQYARGYSDPPPDAQWLCLIGADAEAGPVDWVWRMPGGGKILMHNGDNLAMFCSDPRVQPNLLWDVLHALVFSDEPRAHQPGPATATSFAQTSG